MLSCKQIVELYTAYEEGVLSEAERAEYEGHMGACPPCAEYVKQLVTAVSHAKQGCKSPLSDEVECRLMGVFRAWKKRQGC